MRILVVGAGAREHALAWRLTLAGHELHAAPGNPGIAQVARLHDARAENVPAQVVLARELEVDLVVVGPEMPLAFGLVDALEAEGIAAFGPTQKAARLESSKVFAKEFLERHAIASAPFRSASSVADALDAARGFGWPCVLKADGLAAGKGVVVARDEPEARAFAERCFTLKALGDAGSRMVVEQFLPGEEASLFFLSDGARVARFLPARDYKRLGDGDEGPNTGGMGAFAPAPLDDALCARVETEIAQKTIDAMAAEGAPFRGLLYVGLMIDRGTARVLEFNCRFGDPETQVLMPLLASDPGELFAQCARGRLEEPLAFSRDAAVGVVLAAPGYPDAPRTGGRIEGLEDASETWFFHAGTRQTDEGLVAAGGRVLTVVAKRATLAEARAAAYASIDRITLEGAQLRRDVGLVPAASRS